MDEEEGVVAGSMSLLPENDPAYAAVSWTGTHALVMHRVMVDPLYRRRRHRRVALRVRDFPS
ncbi:MAG: hypothetical protein MZW92_02720 [Comamonadaceae bacterium]|nr:hypothetical protein [Comamonadaceae bacterium]